MTRGARSMISWRRGWLARIVAVLAAAYLRLVFLTSRWDRIGQSHLDSVAAGGGFVACFWHGRLFAVTMAYRRRGGMAAIVSQSRDGEVIAQLLARFGVNAIRGSSRDPRKPDRDRGGGQAAKASLRAVRDGAALAVIPDGPRGPLMRAKLGPAWIAASARAPVLPVAFSTRRGKVFDSWDRFLLPWPLNRGVFVYGAPLQPPETLDADALEAFRLEIEEAVTAATRRADLEMGRATPAPAPAAAA